MSECVVRMEMPQRCAECPIQGYALNCRIPLPHDKSALRSPSERPSWCPILAVLPEKHGRLVDADKLMQDIEEYHVSDGYFQHWLELQPTIVPATERSET